MCKSTIVYGEEVGTPCAFGGGGLNDGANGDILLDLIVDASLESAVLDTLESVDK